MKKLFCIFIIALVSSTANGQSTLEDWYINKNTGDTIMVTYWRNLFADRDFLVNYRLKRINSTTYIELKFHVGPYGGFTVSDTNSLWIKTMADETIILKSDRNVTATRGGGRIKKTGEGRPELTGATVHGVQAFYPVPRKYCLVLQIDLIKKMRIFCSSGYYDAKIKVSTTDFANDFRLISQKSDKIKRKIPPPEKKLFDVEPW
ncbi:MAG: hypothetical protein ISR57_00090 [Bacteroidales bacterium]|nr:hypothetical protein [candidate division KSB1 bacterium]MBL6949022.1 hypothetical protein [Bacteroidales bacterium]